MNLVKIYLSFISYCFIHSRRYFGEGKNLITIFRKIDHTIHSHLSCPVSLNTCTVERTYLPF